MALKVSNKNRKKESIVTVADIAEDIKIMDKSDYRTCSDTEWDGMDNGSYLFRSVAIISTAMVIFITLIMMVI